MEQATRSEPPCPARVPAVPKERGLGALGLGRALAIALRDAMLVTVACTLLAVGINLFHPERIPLLATKRYETLVPCPEPGGAVTLLRAEDARMTAASTFVVDARTAEAFKRWHFPGAMNVTYDYLDPTPKELLTRLARRAASSLAQRVVVYGDGDDPDSGEQLGKELSLQGIKNVFFVQGGAKALRATKGRRP